MDGGLLKDVAEAEHAGLRGVGGGLVGGQQVDEEFYFAQASDVTVEADGGADVEAVEDVYFLVVDVPVVIFVEGLCEKAWLEVEGGGEGGIDVTEVGYSFV